jgi:hypothetical protein
MIDPNWTRWVLSSLYDHFRKQLVIANCSLFIDNEIRQDVTSPNRLELRSLGPTYQGLTATETKVTIKVNICVRTQWNDGNPLEHLSRLGIVQSKFVECLSIYKYGPTPAIDDKSLLTALSLAQGKLLTTNFGRIDAVSPIVMTTVEGDYEGYLAR